MTVIFFCNGGNVYDSTVRAMRIVMEKGLTALEELLALLLILLLSRVCSKRFKQTLITGHYGAMACAL